MPVWCMYSTRRVSKQVNLSYVEIAMHVNALCSGARKSKQEGIPAWKSVVRRRRAGLRRNLTLQLKTRDSTLARPDS